MEQTPRQLRNFLEGQDDQSFCDFLVSSAQVGDDASQALAPLYEPWILQRLRQIRERAAHIYFGTFLDPLRRLYPGRVYPDALHEAMRGIESFQEHAAGDLPAEEWRAATEALFRDGIKPGCSPGWRNVAEHYTVRAGELSIVTGIASHMKSTWVHALCVNLARQYGWRFGIFSPEHQPSAYLAALLLEQYTGIPLREMPHDMFQDTLGWVMEHFHCIQPPEEVPPTLPYLLAIARQQVERYQIQGLVLDPWNEIDHQFGRQSETQYISEALSKIRRFGRFQGVHTWIVAHPQKMQKAVSGPYAGKYPPPRPYDINGSGHWYNKADNCICIWRDVEEDSPVIEVHIQKVRYRTLGRPGLVTLHFTGAHFLEPEVAEDLAWLR